MSSSMNNNLTQNIITPSNTMDFASSRQGSSTTINATKSQRSPHDQASSSQKGRSGRAGRGRGRQNKSDTSGNKVIEKTTPDVAESGSNSVGDVPANAHQINIGASGSSSGRVKGYKGPGHRGVGGKNRQRQQTVQLIEGMSTLSGLDIDLVESVAPTNSDGRVSDTGKGRHAINNRKINLTHLLNYKFERKNRGRYNSTSSTGDSNTASYHHHQKNSGTQYRDPGTFHKFSKQQFLQANCQFVVLDGHDYTVHKVDPDWPVEWDCIEEVRFKQSASTETSCPICLEPPVAAKITRCGHIYCWTCMLHYLSLSDEKSRQCPICFERVYRGDLRSVISHSFINHSVEEEIAMRLMIRKKGCVEVEPYKVINSYTSAPTIDSPENQNDHYWSQANLVIVDPSTVITNVAKRERDELLVKLALDKDEPEVCFIEQAISWLEQRVEKLQQLATVNETKTIENSSPPFQIDNDSSKSYLFYQCSDGQHIYLNPFSTKILCHEYKNLESCPSEIRARILQMDWISMSESWRKRFRYLEHLPLTCEFRLIEIDFENSGIISLETYKVFEEQIKKREQEREKRRREERKREKIIQVEQNRKIYGIQPSLKINLDNFDQFPSVSDERYLGLSQPRNRTRDDEGLSSDENEPNETAQVLHNEPHQEEPATTSSSGGAGGPPSQEIVSQVALSFKDIQLQEAALEAKSSKNSCKTANVWTCKKQGSGSTPQSSFAQLLVNAKASQKEWTRNVNSTASTSNIPGPQASSSSWISPGSDDGSEELRAPPHEFTINDFIDINVITTSGKKKGKSRSSNKKI